MYKKITVIAAVWFIIWLSLTACSGPSEYGTGVDAGLPEVRVQDVLADNSIPGTRVNLQGEIITLCPSRGCWLFLRDSSGMIHVDLSQAEIYLPSRTMGSRIMVSGTVDLEEGRPVMKAEGLEVF